MLEFSCHHCGQLINVDSSFVGASLECPTCHGALVVPPLPEARDNSGADSLRARLGPARPLASRQSSAAGFFKSWAFIGSAIALVMILTLWSLAGRRTIQNTVAVVAAEQPPAVESEIKAAREVIEEMEALVTNPAAKSPESGKGQTSQPEDSSKKSRAVRDLETTGNLVKSLMQDMTSTQAAYEEAISVAGFGRLLQADRVAGDTGFRESHAILSKVKDTVADYSERVSQVMQSFPERLSDVEMDEEAKKAFLDGYNRNLGQALRSLKEIWSIESQIVGYLEELIQHLKDTRSHWEPVNGQFIFQREADADRFNDITAKISSASAKQAKIREEMAQGAKDRLSGMKDDLPQ